MISRRSALATFASLALAPIASAQAQSYPDKPQDFAAFIAAEAPRWAALVRASGARME